MTLEIKGLERVRIRAERKIDNSMILERTSLLQLGIR